MSVKRVDFAHSRALLIGASVYDHRKFRDLAAAGNSLEGLRELLVHPDLGTWPKERVTVWANPVGSSRAITELRRLSAETTGVLLLYFVGHGRISPAGDLCLALSDTDFDHADVTGLDYRYVSSALRDSPAKVKIVILDCCYSGRAIQSLGSAEDIANLTAIQGVYVIAASDQSAHVPPASQVGACTSFTGELLDLVRTGVPGQQEVLTVSEIYKHLRQRLKERNLPLPLQQGTDTADEFVFSRNAALLPEPLERFPRPPRRPLDFLLSRRAVAIGASAVLVAGLGAGALYGQRNWFGAAEASSLTVTVGSGNFPESALLAEIYAEALEGKGITVERTFSIGNRKQYLASVQQGDTTIVPEYLGQLLSAIDPASDTNGTQAIAGELKQKLGPELEILEPAAAQDQDTITVTRSVANANRLKSIADLKDLAGSWIIGAPAEFEDREQGTLGLRKEYGLKFKDVLVLDSGEPSVQALQEGRVQAADIFSTDPALRTGDLVRLDDPKAVFTVQNVVPLVHRSGVDQTVRTALNAVSARLGQQQLLGLNEQLAQGRPKEKVAEKWLEDVGLT
jgi:glycine betaine/choline ABC-type transport system substrate-binding protein